MSMWVKLDKFVMRHNKFSPHVSDKVEVKIFKIALPLHSDSVVGLRHARMHACVPVGLNPHCVPVRKDGVVFACFLWQADTVRVLQDRDGNTMEARSVERNSGSLRFREASPCLLCFDDWHFSITKSCDKYFELSAEQYRIAQQPSFMVENWRWANTKGSS